MDMYGFLLLVGVFGALAVTGLKLYNIMHKGEKYDIKLGVLIFAAFMLFWLFSFLAATTVATVKITDVVGSAFDSTARPYEPIFVILYNLTTWLIALNFILLIIEVFLHIRRKSEQAVQAYMSNDFLKR